METESYKLRYLPLFYSDLESITSYIAGTLMNPGAADNLINEVEAAILERAKAAESFEKYCSLKERRYPYYRIYVKNYVIYYVVIDDEGEAKIMEVRRMLYQGRNRDKMI